MRPKTRANGGKFTIYLFILKLNSKGVPLRFILYIVLYTITLWYGTAKEKTIITRHPKDSTGTAQKRVFAQNQGFAAILPQAPAVRADSPE